MYYSNRDLVYLKVFSIFFFYKIRIFSNVYITIINFEAKRILDYKLCIFIYLFNASTLLMCSYFMKTELPETMEKSNYKSKNRILTEK
jgi:hypothetical protein